MKLIRFKIKDKKGFRALQEDFEIFFLRDFDYQFAQDFNPNILAGRNGSGKSNVLEALANIFYHLDCMYNDSLPDGFLKGDDNHSGFDNTICVVDAFELEYFIPVPDEFRDETNKALTNIAFIRISKEFAKTPVFEWVNKNEYSTQNEILGKKEIQKLLPTYVLGYSSGENELLSLPFFKTRFLHFDEYADKLSKQENYGTPPKPEGRLVYLDYQYSQAILLANILMQDDKVLEPFRNEIELVGLDEFRLIICQDKYIDLHEDILRDKTRKIEELYDEKPNAVQLTTNLNDSIERLKQCSTCFNYDSLEFEFGEVSREYLVLDYKVDEETKKAFRFHFSNNPLELFQLFQILLELNAYVVSKEDKNRVYQSKNIFINHDIYPSPLEDDRILRFKNLWIKKNGLDNPLFTKELSDGEYQFLHTLGLCLLFKNENCLFLLDEPETHFNPDWKAKFISSIRHCFKQKNEDTMQEMLITTHSPYLVSDSESRYVFAFIKDENKKIVSCEHPDFQTLGESVNNISVSIYDKANTIGDYALQKLNEYKDRFNKGENGKAIIKEMNRSLGDSLEKTLLINRILDKK